VTEPTSTATPAPTPAPTPRPTNPIDQTPTTAAVPALKHVIVVSLTGQDAATAFAPDSPATYLTGDLRSQGTYLAGLRALSTGSLANVLALLAGAAPTPEMQADCAQGGDACRVTAPSLPGELITASKTWKGYVQGATAPCAAPPQGGFTVSRDPFPYLDDVAGGCADADGSLDALETDLAAAKSAPSLAWVVPDRCHDGHDADCPDAAADGDSGLARANTWLQTWVPKIIGSKAFRDGGMLVVLFDGGGLPASAAAAEPPKVGAVVVSSVAHAGTTSRKPYDLLSLSRTLAAGLGVDPPGAAANDGIAVFGKEVFGKTSARSRNVDGSVTTP
jgi:hypothetical protein